MSLLPEDEGIELPVSCIPTKIKITKSSRSRIEELIITNITRTIGVYCDKVGIQPSNYYAILSGRRACTLDQLNKILSGIGYQVTAETKLVVHRIDVGPNAQTVDSTEQETEWPLNDEEATDEYDCFL